MDTSAQDRCDRLGRHSLVPIAEWKVRGSEVPGLMQACAQCGLIMIEDRRGTLLIGPKGFGGMHKRIFPCQRPPACKQRRQEASALLDAIRHQLAAKHDPRFQLFA